MLLMILNNDDDDNNENNNNNGCNSLEKSINQSIDQWKHVILFLNNKMVMMMVI